MDVLTQRSQPCPICFRHGPVQPQQCRLLRQIHNHQPRLRRSHRFKLSLNLYHRYSKLPRQLQLHPSMPRTTLGRILETVTLTSTLLSTITKIHHLLNLHLMGLRPLTTNTAIMRLLLLLQVIPAKEATNITSILVIIPLPLITLRTGHHPLFMLPHLPHMLHLTLIHILHLQPRLQTMAPMSTNIHTLLHLLNIPTRSQITTMALFSLLRLEIPTHKILELQSVLPIEDITRKEDTTTRHTTNTPHLRNNSSSSGTLHLRTGTRTTQVTAGASLDLPDSGLQGRTCNHLLRTWDTSPARG